MACSPQSGGTFGVGSLRLIVGLIKRVDFVRYTGLNIKIINNPHTKMNEEYSNETQATSSQVVIQILFLLKIVNYLKLMNWKLISDLTELFNPTHGSIEGNEIEGELQVWNKKDQRVKNLPDAEEKKNTTSQLLLPLYFC